MFAGSSPITSPSAPLKTHQKSGAFPPPELPGFDGTMTLSDSRLDHRPLSGGENATLIQSGPPPITRLTLPTCRAHYPGGSEQVQVSVASPSNSGLPRYSGGSASATSLSRPAQASHTLRPAGLLNRPRRPLSRGFIPTDYSPEMLVSYQILPTTFWVDPSSTGVLRLRGALNKTG